jgi:phosphohistidine phosphatase
MNIIVMRHGPAEDRSLSGADRERCLTHPGRQVVRNVAELLIKQGRVPSRILTSPFVRAVQTAELVSHYAPPSTLVHVHPKLVPNQDLYPVLTELSGLEDETILLVSHEPSLSQLIDDILDGDWNHHFQSGMMIGLQTQPNSFSVRLEFQIDPIQVRWTAID